MKLREFIRNNCGNPPRLEEYSLMYELADNLFPDGVHHNLDLLPHEMDFLTQNYPEPAPESPEERQRKQEMGGLMAKLGLARK